jgi:hypothetical protein
MIHELHTGACFPIEHARYKASHPGTHPKWCSWFCLKVIDGPIARALAIRELDMLADSLEICFCNRILQQLPPNLCCWGATLQKAINCVYEAVDCIIHKGPIVIRLPTSSQVAIGLFLE